MTFAIFDISGTQYIASPGESITVKGQSFAVGSDITAPVLLLSENSNIQIGQPHLTATAHLTVVSHLKGEKVEVRTYKAKSRYRRHRGYRDTLSMLKIVSFGVKKAQTVKKTTSKPSKSQ